MKRYFTLVGILFIFGCSLCASAEEMDVLRIGGDWIEREQTTFDDVKIGHTIEEYDTCSVTVTSFDFVDAIGAYGEGGIAYKDTSEMAFFSGNEADYAILKVDITNLKTTDVDYTRDTEVKVIYDERYVYDGWIRQYNWDYKRGYDDWNKADGLSTINANKEFIIQENDNFSIKPMYTGHFCFGCKLPNKVIKADSSLRMEISFAGIEMTYIIRK